MRLYMIKGPIFFLVLLIILCLICQNTIAEGEACHDCHGTDGGYTFQHISVSCSTPRVVNPGEEFEHVVVLDHPGDYIANSIKVELIADSAQELTLIDDESTIQLPSMGKGSKSVAFKMRSGDPSQSQRLRTKITYSADYHYDPTEYTEIVDISITIDRILLTTSEWSIEISKGEQKEISLSALENVQNVKVIPSASLDGVVELNYKVPRNLPKDNSFSIQLKALGTGNGKLNLVYEDEDGGPHKLTLDISITEKVESEGDVWVRVGIITGISSWIILILSVLVGVPLLKLKPAFNKVFRNALVRTKFHCGICYILVFLVLLHGVVVMANHWDGTMIGDSFIFANPVMNYGLYINLGTVAWLLMVIVSITGIIVKPMSKTIKYRGWRYTHNIITLLALITSSIHIAVMLHFRFL